MELAGRQQTNGIDRNRQLRLSGYLYAEGHGEVQRAGRPTGAHPSAK